mgnify:CR=1 FL=1
MEKKKRSKIASFDGFTLESQVLKDYKFCGYKILYQRWSGPSGEINLVASKEDILVFLEVKKSSTQVRANEALI